MIWRFFGGKGGVGKTTCAAASALAAAEAPGKKDKNGGRRVLIVSTDPAPSLGDALGIPLTDRPQAIPTRRGTLLAAELDAEASLERWRARHRETLRTLAERGTYLDGEDVDRLLGLSLPGADELFGLLELARLARETPCDELVVDTAPTAHTLRLLDIPAALRRYAGALDRLQSRHRALSESFAGAYREDEVDALIAGIADEGRELEEALRDPARTSLTWITLPEALSLAEARDAVAALDEAGIPVGEVVVNRVTPPEAAEGCPACAERRRAELGVVEEIEVAFQDRQLPFVPAQPGEPRGLPYLRKVGKFLSGPGEPKGPSPLGGGGWDRGEDRRGAGAISGDAVFAEAAAPLLSSPRLQPSPSPGGGTLRSTALELPSWVQTLAPEGTRLLLFGGKGGVGKTTCAAAAALTLAAFHPDRRILLLSTDPAHSLSDVLDLPLGDDERPVPGSPNLLARELDAPRAFSEWRDRHRGQVAEALGSFNSDLDAADLLEAPPPGLDELVAMATLFDPLPCDLVIVDTAPTGHALRLLQMPALALAWDHALLAVLLKYREAVGLGDFAAELVDLSRSLKRLQALLADPDRTRFVAVTRPAELPRLETERLLRSLQELSIAVPAVVVNAVPASAPGCRYCAPQRETRAIERAAAIVEAPAIYPPPRGVAALSDWARGWAAEPFRNRISKPRT